MGVIQVLAIMECAKIRKICSVVHVNLVGREISVIHQNAILPVQTQRAVVGNVTISSTRLFACEHQNTNLETYSLDGYSKDFKMGCEEMKFH